MKTLKLMRRLILLLPAFLFLSTQITSAQTVRAQLVHVSADPAVDTVDIYIGAALTIDDFAFLGATPFMDLPAGTQEIVVAPSSSSSAEDAIATFTAVLDSGSTYHLVVAGVTEPDEFKPNPDGRDITLNLFVDDGALEQSPDNRFWGRQFYAGTDLPKMRFTYGPDDDRPFDDASYGHFTIYAGGEGEVASIRLWSADMRTSPLWEQTYDSRPLEGKAFLGITYGFFADDNGLSFGLMTVRADGTVEVLDNQRALSRTQIVHNSADPALGTVDLYLDGGLLVDDFEFQTATKFMDLPSGWREFTIAPGQSSGLTDGLQTKRTPLREGKRHSIVAAGVVDPKKWPANPDGLDTRLDLFVVDDARETSGNQGEFTLRQFYGITDLPSCNFLEGSDRLFENKKYAEFTEYMSASAGSYVGSLRAAGSGTSALVELQGAFSTLGGLGILEMPSGFFRDEGGLAIDWLQVLPDGTVIKPVQSTRTFDVQIVHASPDPAVETVDVYLDGGLLIDDFSYRTAKPFLELPYGIHELTITASSSTGKQDAIATFRETFRSERNYSMVLAGVVDPGQWPGNPDGRDVSLNLFKTDDALEVSTSPNDYSIRQFYGVVDFPAIDFWLDTDHSIMWESIDFGEFTTYRSWDHAETLTGTVRSAGSGENGPILISTRKNWGPYRRQAVLEVITGSTDNLEWFYLTPDGTVEHHDIVTAVSNEAEPEVPVDFVLHGNYPNPFNPSTSIVFDLPESASVSVEVFDATGRRMIRTEEATFSAGAGHAVQVDATAWGSGLYLYKLIARSRTSSRLVGVGRMMLVK